jgi:hypothetical protein
MKAMGPLRAARVFGIELEADGYDLVLRADSKPSAEVLEDLVRHKTEIVALLSLGQGVWSAEDWRHSSTSALDSRSLMLNSGALKPRHGRSPAVSSNG